MKQNVVYPVRLGPDVGRKDKQSNQVSQMDKICNMQPEVMCIYLIQP